MPGEDQERFEDYLDLERFISELQAGQVAHPPQQLTHAQARIYLMATQFHAATPGVSEPRPEFAEHLQRLLEGELESQQDTQQLPKILPVKARPQKRLSRRMLLSGSATAAASIVAGAVTDHVVEQTLHGSALPGISSVEPTKWFSVCDVAALGTQAVKFVNEQMVGYVLRCDESAANPADRGEIIAVSAACTHMGCIVQWNKDERRFHCPCHDSVFLQDGGIDAYMSSLYLKALPRLDVQLFEGKVQVKMPADPSASTQDQDGNQNASGPMRSKGPGW